MRNRINHALILLRVLVVALAMATPSYALAQSPAPNGVGAVIDPTKNVLDLVQAAIKRQDDLRDAEAKLQTSLRDAETRRLNELAVQKQGFDLELSKLLRANAEEKATLIAGQLKEVKNDLSDRVSKLEQFRWESGGRNSGQGDIIGWIVGGVMMFVAIGSLITTVAVAMRRNKEGMARV